MSASTHDHPELGPAEVVEVADRVFADIQPDGSWYINNTGFVVGDRQVIRIDAAVVKAGNVARIRQVAYIVPRAHKMAALARLLDVEQPTSAIVFCRTRTEVDELTETLNGRGFHAEALHGGLSQEQRDRVMKRFRANTSELLVATDVAARGLDVSHVSHVVNYDVPMQPEDYVHRIGRTGRAQAVGQAYTLVTPLDAPIIQRIEKVLKQQLKRRKIAGLDYNAPPTSLAGMIRL